MGGFDRRAMIITYLVTQRGDHREVEALTVSEMRDRAMQGAQARATASRETT